jgi:DNA-binding MarR family transcriptional regulator
MQAIGARGTSTSEIGRRLGVSKQAAARTVDRLEQLGYIERTADEIDGRRHIVRLTDHGRDALRRSAEVFDQLRAQWARVIGPARLHDMEDSLRCLVPVRAARLDVAGWLGH